MAEKGQGMLLKAQGRTLSTFREDTEREWKAPFYFIQGADPQFGLMKAYAIGDCGSDGDEWGEELRLMQQAVLAINKLNPKPKFFILCGDLIHGMPGNDCSKLCEPSLGIQNLSDQEAKHFMWFLSPRTDLFLKFLKLCKALERGTPWREAQECDLKNTLKDVSSNIPVIFVSGNHDLGNTPTPETIDDYCQQWGDDYFSFWAGGVFFLVLNSQLFFDHSKCPELKRAQDAWLLEQLAVAEERRCKHAVVFQHIPLFLKTPDEEDDYFNLEKSVRQDLLEKFHKAGIKVVFSGHYHRNAGGTYKDLEMVVSSAIGCQLGEDTHGLRMVVVSAEKIVHRYYSLSQLSDQGLDKDLMDLLK